MNNINLYKNLLIWIFTTTGLFHFLSWYIPMYLTYAYIGGPEWFLWNTFFFFQIMISIAHDDDFGQHFPDNNPPPSKSHHHLPPSRHDPPPSTSDWKNKIFVYNYYRCCFILSFTLSSFFSKSLARTISTFFAQLHF